MRSCETVSLKMMDRLETIKDYDYRTRKAIYLKHLRFWNDKISKGLVDLFISSNVPHEGSDYVLYCLCKLKKIPVVIVCQTHIPDTVLVFNDWENSDYGLPKEIAKLTKQFKGKKPQSILLGEGFHQYYLKQIADTDIASPFYMHKQSLSARAATKAPNIYKKLKQNRLAYFKEGRLIIKALFRKNKISLQTRSLMRYYESKCSAYEAKQKYFFVALHVQPEMSTSPRADAYVEQIMLLGLLSACAPKGVKIYVKEHPNQNALSRSRQYYKDILAMPNVRLISRKIRSKDLVKNAMAIVTGVGLVGFESLFQGKPVLMFGHDFFQSAPGVFAIRTKADLTEAIEKIMKGKPATEKEFKIYLKALENVSVHGTIDSDYMPTSTIEPELNTLNISQAIIKEYKKQIR
jgi:hypothetical protein